MEVHVPAEYAVQNCIEGFDGKFRKAADGIEEDTLNDLHSDSNVKCWDVQCTMSNTLVKPPDYPMTH